MKIYNFEQRSEEWFKIREKKMTASHATAIGNNGKGLTTYIMSIMQEYYSKAEKEHYSNKHTERGNELEDSAAFLYEQTTGTETQKVGFVEYNEYVGCSPDRIAETGLVEIKCPDDKAYFDLLINDKIDSDYIWQMQMQMLICEKDWCDFVAYNPNFDQEIIIKRVYKNIETQQKLLNGFESGIKMIKEIEKKMEGK